MNPPSRRWWERFRRWLTGLRRPAPGLARQGEELACRHLRKQGYRILATGWRWKRYELDIIARKGDVISIVEVKTRADLSHGQPQQAVDRVKQHHILMAARAYVAARRLHRCIVRFDVIAIHMPPDASPQITHIENAFQPS